MPWVLSKQVEGVTIGKEKQRYKGKSWESLAEIKPLVQVAEESVSLKLERIK